MAQSAAAKRQAEKRVRDALGIIVLQVEVDSHDMSEWLLDRGATAEQSRSRSYMAEEASKCLRPILRGRVTRDVPLASGNAILPQEESDMSIFNRLTNPPPTQATLPVASPAAIAADVSKPKALEEIEGRVSTLRRQRDGVAAEIRRLGSSLGVIGPEGLEAQQTMPRLERERVALEQEITSLRPKLRALRAAHVVNVTAALRPCRVEAATAALQHLMDLRNALAILSECDATLERHHGEVEHLITPDFGWIEAALRRRAR